MVVEEGVEVLNQDQPVTDVLMPADVTGKGIMLSHASLAWSVIERGGKLAVRIRDYEHPFVATFGPLPYYDIDPAQRVVATLRKYDEPRTITVNTVIEGLQQFPESPGVVEFELDGQLYQLEAETSANDRLFIVFGDETNRGETYGAGRFVYMDDPGSDGGEAILDFNKAYSPPCAFNDFSTCPVASPRNRLAVRIDAGEKFDPNLHYSEWSRALDDVEGQTRVLPKPLNERSAHGRSRCPHSATRLDVIPGKAYSRFREHLAGRAVAWVLVARDMGAQDLAVRQMPDLHQLEESGFLQLR